MRCGERKSNLEAELAVGGSGGMENFIPDFVFEDVDLFFPYLLSKFVSFL